MNLRNYQQKAVADIYSGWTRSNNLIFQLATGGGKTRIFTYLLYKHVGYSVVIAHRLEIVSQISLNLAGAGIRHNIIGQKDLIRDCVAIQMDAFKQSFYYPQAQCIVACVDTLITMKPHENPWFFKISLVVIDEAHHVLALNKWGRAASLFPNAKKLLPTATPLRADGYGLGRNSDGIADEIILGPPMRHLIKEGYLTDYRIFAPPSDLDLSNVTTSAGGDFSPPKLSTAVHKSHITGDVVAHYLKIAPGKLGVTFAVDIQAATEIAQAFRAAGVAAEVVTSRTHVILRANIMRRFKNGEILQLVNVDLLGEGVDVPAMEVVSFARPTQSYAVYAQQFGRPLRPSKGKDFAIIIDHVGNTLRHGLPDAPRTWTLNRRERRKKEESDLNVLRICPNPSCNLVYEKFMPACPWCHFKPEPIERSLPKMVDGDLFELNAETLAKMRGEIKHVDDDAYPPRHLDPIAQSAIIKRHRDRQNAQTELRDTIKLWAGWLKALGKEDSEIYKRFFFTFGTDILSAQALNTKDAGTLNEKIKLEFTIDKITNSG